MNVDAVKAGRCRAAGGLRKGLNNSLNVVLGHFTGLPSKYRILNDRGRHWIDIRHDRLAAGMGKLAKNPAAVFVHRRRQSCETGG